MSCVGFRYILWGAWQSVPNKFAKSSGLISRQLAVVFITDIAQIIIKHFGNVF